MKDHILASTSQGNGGADSSRGGWRLLLRGLEVRLRFVLLVALFAAVVTGWSWLRAAWDRAVAAWHPHGTSAAVSGDTEFFCPMDPGVVSGWPAICPICNMDLVPRKKSDAVLLPEGVVARMQISSYRVQLAGVRTVPVQQRPLACSEPPSTAAADSTTQQSLVVPASAVVQHGSEAVVYVETMPGMFDGVRVELGERCGDVYPVLSGLKSSQRVVAMGAFLLDAESRLNPSLAVQYFGANADEADRRVPTPPPRRTSPSPSSPSLTDADKLLVQQQRICPVTEKPLGSMGEPVAVTVRGRKVFLCCRGCEGAVRDNPDKYLARLPAATAEP